MTIRKIDIELEERVETGAVQFGDDWPGVFIRGDNAGYYALMLESVLRGDNDPYALIAVNSLLRLLRESRV